MGNSLVISAPGTLSAPSALAPRRLHAFPAPAGATAPTHRWVASQLQLLPAANVASWPDLIGAAPFNPGAANTQPTVERVNNVYGVLTDGVDDIMGTGSASITDAVWTLIAVSRMGVSAANKALLNIQNYTVATDGSNQFRFYGSAAVKPGSAPVADTGLHFLAAVLNGASSIFRVDSYTASGNPSAITTSPNQLYFASSTASVAHAEIVYIPGAYTDAQLQAVRTSLRSIYPTLPA